VSPAQLAALAKVRADGTVYAYNGVTIATARALASMNVVVFTDHGTQRELTRRGRWVLTRNWSITIAPQNSE
jgi:hypothetical protein